MLIYLVSSGQHSDYMVEGIYSTKELAEEANKLYEEENPIEEFELDKAPDHPSGMYPYFVLMDKDGNSRKVGLVGLITIRNCELSGKWYWKNARDRGCRILTDETFCEFYMFAKDETHAVKIANERRAMLIANGEW